MAKYMSAAASIVLINGLWMTALSWEHWVKLYADKSYQVVARSWPGMEGDIEQLRRNPSGIAKLGLVELVQHYEQIICQLDEPPIIIGHGFGGLVAQILLDRGWGAVGIAIASAPPAGVFRLPFSALRLLLPALGNSLTGQRIISLTPEQFHYAFTNTLNTTESKSVYKQYVVPAPTRILRQAALGNFSRNPATAVNFQNNTRAPLLFVAGGNDRLAPTSLVKANFELYRSSKAETHYQEIRQSTHYIVNEEDWRNVANYVLNWALRRINAGSDLQGTQIQNANWSIQL